MTRQDPWQGILAGPIDGPAKVRATYPEIEGRAGLAVEHRASGLRGVLVRLEADAASVRTPLGTDRLLALRPGAFAVNGQAVTLVRTRGGPHPRPSRTASGSRSTPRAPARVARASRILVEGIHDAELIERVWGDDLRVEGVVVERLDGIDHLVTAIAQLRPRPGARLGVLVDHLVPGSKEARLAAAVHHPHVLVTGTPFVDIWQAIRPRVAGIDAWPVITRDRPWKTGICEALGESDPAAVWRRLLASVHTYADLEADLVGAIERLIDFVTADGDT